MILLYIYIVGVMEVIICTLAEILSKQQLKIADVVQDTGISRPTLTNLCYNTGKGINFDTLDVLCHYLSVTPGDLFVRYDDIFAVKIWTIPDFGFLSNAKESSVILGFYGAVELSTRYDRVKILGIVTPGKAENTFDVKLNSYTRPGEIRLLAKMLLRDLVTDALMDEMKRHINQNCKIGQIRILFKDPGHIQKDFRNANLNKTMIQAMYGEEEEDKK